MQNGVNGMQQAGGIHSAVLGDLPNHNSGVLVINDILSFCSHCTYAIIINIVNPVRLIGIRKLSKYFRIAQQHAASPVKILAIEGDSQ